MCFFVQNVLCVIFSVCVFVFAFFIVMCFRGDVYLQRKCIVFQGVYVRCKDNMVLTRYST